jgi:hypothetical protein
LVRKVHGPRRRHTRHFFRGRLGACAGRCSAALSLILICRFVVLAFVLFLFSLVSWYAHARRGRWPALVSMRTTSGPTSGQGEEMLPVESRIEESFPTSASIQGACWSLGVVYELRCLVHAWQQHGQMDGWCGDDDRRHWRVPPGSHWDVTLSVWVRRGCSSTCSSVSYQKTCFHSLVNAPPEKPKLSQNEAHTAPQQRDGFLIVITWPLRTGNNLSPP